MAFFVGYGHRWALALLGAALLLGCDLSSKPAPTDAGAHGEVPPAVAGTLTLDARGGVIALLDHESDLFGASLRLPPDALTGPTALSLAVAEALPAGSDAFGVGPVLEVGPTDAVFRRPGLLELPIRDGTAAEGLAVARWDADASSWTILPDTTGRAQDPRAERGATLAVPVSGSGSFRAVYREPQPVAVLNEGSGPLQLALGAHRFTTDAGRGYMPPPPAEGELARTVPMGEVGTLHLLPGDYVLHGTFEGERVPRCATVSVTDPVSSTDPLGLSFSDFTGPCAVPAVRITATPRTARAGETVTMQAAATGGGGAGVSYHWVLTGGELDGATSGTAASGEMVQTTWTAPEAPGEHWVSFVAYVDATLFAAAHARIEVGTADQPPRISRFEASPDVIGPGFPEGARAVAEQGNPGVTRVRVVASDLDGDALDVFWVHGEPGGFHDVASGVRLGRDEETGLVIWPETGEPYREAQILYMAPEASVVSSWSRGMWFPFGATVSDGELRDVSWVMAAVVRQAPGPTVDAGPDTDAGPARDGGTRDAGRDGGPDAAMPAVVGRCLGVVERECEMWIGSSYGSELEPLESGCLAEGRTWTESFACPESGAIGACYRFHGEPREVATVYYGSSPTMGQIEMLSSTCRATPVAEGGPGTWQRPYRAPR